MRSRSAAGRCRGRASIRRSRGPTPGAALLRQPGPWRRSARRPRSATAAVRGCGNRRIHSLTSSSDRLRGRWGPYRKTTARSQLLQDQTPMHIRIRKLIGGIALIVLVLGWALLAMALAQLPVIKANAVVEAIYYVVAGLGWLLLAMPLVKWMVLDKRASADRETHRPLP